MDNLATADGVGRYLRLAESLIRAPKGAKLITGPTNKVFTQDEANVLTKDGFIDYCNELRNSMTYKEAYEATEAVHQRVHKKGKRKYSEFLTFARVVTNSKQKAPTS